MFDEKRQEGYFKRLAPVMTRRRALGLLLIISFLVPYPTTVVPEWKIRVIDQDGRPFVGEEVREIWQHYSLESEGHEEERLTDEKGYVVFPERRIWSPLLWRIFSTGIAAALTLAHGSMGVSAWVMVIGYSTNGGTRDYKPGKPLPGEIVLQR
jgi:hypothetical protein